MSSTGVTSETVINGWDSDVVAFVKTVGDKSGAFNWIHNNTAWWYNLFYNIIQIGLVLFMMPLVGGPLTMISKTLDVVYLKVVLAAWAGLLAIFISIHTYLQWTDRISAHRSAATTYLLIYVRIRKELIKEPEDRREGNKFLEDIEDEYRECYRDSPPVWSLTTRRYLRKAKNRTNITMADLGGIAYIQVRRRHVRRRRRPRTQDEDDSGESSEEEVVTPKTEGGFLQKWFQMNKAKNQWQLERHTLDDLV